MRERIERLDKYLKYKKLNDNQVTVQCGLSQGLLSKARSGKTDIGMKAVDKILNKFQDLSRVWLLTGEGDMLLSSDINKGAAVIHGNNIVESDVDVHQTVSTADSKLLDELAAQRRLTEQAQQQAKEQIARAQAQTDRALAMLEKLINGR